MTALRDIFRRLGHSLTARLLFIFFIASMAYWQASVFAFSLFQDTDYLRRIVGAHTALHTEYILSDIGSPPDIQRAQSIVDRIPVDIRIVEPVVPVDCIDDAYRLLGRRGVIQIHEGPSLDRLRKRRKVTPDT